MRAEWGLAELMGYLDTWSAVRRYRKEQGRDPLPELGDELASVWPAAGERIAVRWALAMRLGRISPAL